MAVRARPSSSSLRSDRACDGRVAPHPRADVHPRLAMGTGRALPSASMVKRAPRWAQAALALDRAAQAGARAVHVLVEEGLKALLDEPERDAVTALVYGEQRSYRPRGVTFEAGLFEWEERALERAAFPVGGRLLLGGAGGGRELAALLERGFEVVAFEPSDLVEAAAELARQHPRARVVRAAFVDLVAAVEARRGPLAEHVARPFDGVVLGWVSFMHVTAESRREALLRALRVVAPGAVVLLSFWPRRPERGRLRPALSRALGYLGRGAEPDLRFAAHAGFYRALDREGLEALAARTGYRVELYDERGAGHALLAPDASGERLASS